MKLSIKMHEYKRIQAIQSTPATVTSTFIPPPVHNPNDEDDDIESTRSKRDREDVTAIDTALDDIAQRDNKRQKLDGSSSNAIVSYNAEQVSALSLYNSAVAPTDRIKTEHTSRALALRREKKTVETPDWHPQWKLMRVISGHLGWVRCLAVDPTNEWFATGAADRTIKIWDLASGTLKLTLTGHTHTVRGLVVSKTSPYLFSVGEDKMVKCWDLEVRMAFVVTII